MGTFPLHCPPARPRGMRRGVMRLAGTGILGVLLATHSVAAAQPIRGKLVRFPSVAGPREQATMLRGWFYFPALSQGRGRVPALVLMHGCGGPKIPSHRWAEQLNTWGMAALVLDSFGPRKIDQVCSDRLRMSSPARTADAYGGLMFLQNQRGVDPDRIGLMGWSHGGSAALWAVDRDWSRAYQPYPWLRFRATTVFYPGCGFTHAAFTTPVLMLMGAADDWTPASPCRRMAKTAQAADGDIELVVYPGATHAFDGVRVPVEAYGHMLEPNPAARLDAHLRVREFLEKYLKS